MRLIHSTSLKFEEFFESELPAYAVLSHRWNDNEVSYQDFLNQSSEDISGSKWKKIVDCCSLAREAGWDWIWVDTCCIDKSSSAELSEAINSMFGWYKKARVCYVFLPDLEVTGKDTSTTRSDFSQSRWFTRGWTLQELIAPHDVRFFDKRLQCIGTKDSLGEEIESITKIPIGFLNGTSRLEDASVAQRMSWASKRSTTRVEDIAYCLLGIFDVNIPLLYGEGPKAFRRLQQAIMSQSDDESIFVWVSPRIGDQRGMLADSPIEFDATGHIRPIRFHRKRPPISLTSRGLEVHHAYAHPLTGLWDSFCESFIGGSPLSAAETIRLRLDCEGIDREGVNYWVGLLLCRDLNTGSWYRQDASKLIYAPQNSLFQKLYPTEVGVKTIYVEAPVRNQILARSTSTPVSDLGTESRDIFSTYLTVSINLLWQAAQLLSGASWIWAVCFVHVPLGPGKVLSWAYLTACWNLQAQQSEFLVTALILGLCGWDFDAHTYASRNIWTALLGIAPMCLLQMFFEVLRWKDLAFHS
jgi:hypothetical protein